MNTISQQVVEARKNRGLTQQELASKAGVEMSVIVDLEAGTLDPKLSIINRIGNVLKWNFQLGNVCI